MDKFVRIEKPIARGKSLKPKASTPSHQTPHQTKLEEWADIVSEEASGIDVSTLSDEQVENVLRLFDLNPTYGPFVGIDRSFRWKRADNWGLNPPLIIKEILETRTAIARREGGSLW